MSRVPAKPTVANTRLTADKSDKSPSGPLGPHASGSVDLTASDSGAAIPARHLDSGLTDGSDASDESADDHMSLVVAPTNWIPPTGNSIADYRDWQNWEKWHWAWEFLRRNASFQAACKKDGRDEARIAQDYRLRRFKHFAQDYKVGKKPSFATGIHSIPKRAAFVERNKSGSGLATVSTLLFPAEVLIKFQLAPTRLAQLAAVKRQLKQAEKRLNSFLIGNLPQHGSRNELVTP